MCRFVHYRPTTFIGFCETGVAFCAGWGDAAPPTTTDSLVPLVTQQRMTPSSTARSACRAAAAVSASLAKMLTAVLRLADQGGKAVEAMRHLRIGRQQKEGEHAAQMQRQQQASQPGSAHCV